MRKCLVALVLLAFISLAYSLDGTILAQEPEDMEFSWGVVKSVSSDQIVVTEYDYDRDEDVEVSYTVDPKAELKGVKSLKDIEAGDILEMDYVTSQGKRTVKVAVVEKAAGEEAGGESKPPQTPAEEPGYPGEETEY